MCFLFIRRKQVCVYIVNNLHIYTVCRVFPFLFIFSLFIENLFKGLFIEIFLFELCIIYMDIYLKTQISMPQCVHVDISSIFMSEFAKSCQINF